MKRTIFGIIAFMLVLNTGVCGQEQDKLLQLLKEELRYNEQELKKQDMAPYFMSFRVLDEDRKSVV